MSGEKPSIEDVLHRRQMEDEMMTCRAEILQAARKSGANGMREAITMLLTRMYVISFAQRLERKKLEARVAALEELVTRP